MTTGGTKNIEPNADWTEQEKWVWAKICLGEIADLNNMDGLKSPLDPNKKEEWPERRILRAEFLQTIVQDEAYRSSISSKGIAIYGAWVRDVFDLTNVNIPFPFLFNKSLFSADVFMSYLKSSAVVAFLNSAFNGDLLSLSSATIGAQLFMSSSTFNCKLEMKGIKVGDNLFLDKKAAFKEVKLSSAKIDGGISMQDSMFSGKLDMQGIEVSESLMMGENASFEEVILRSAAIGGQLAIENSKFSGKLNMENIKVAEYVTMRRKSTFNNVNLSYAEIDKAIDISEASFSSLDLTNTCIKGEFRMYWPEDPEPINKWTGSAKNPLVLNNTKVEAIYHHERAWPDRVELTGFTYSSIKGHSERNNEDVKWMKTWLRKQDYHPQPYEQLSKVLREMGHTKKANEILYAKKERERKDVAEGREFAWLLFLQYTIGYGYKLHYLCIWFLSFLFIGIITLHKSNIAQFSELKDQFIFSLDMLIPVIKLRLTYYEKDLLKGFVEYYFFFHRIIGYVIFTLLVAGISGLTKK